MGSYSARAMIRRFFSPLLALATLPTLLSAQQTSFWISTTGNWSEPGKWSTNPTVPGNSEASAVINSGTVTLDDNFTVGFFGLGGGTLIGLSGRVLTTNNVTFLTGQLGNGNPNNTVTVTASGQIKLLSGAENGTPGTAGNPAFNGSTFNVSASATVTQTNDDGTVGVGSGTVFNNAGQWFARTNNGFNYFGGATTVFNNTGSFIRDTGTGIFNTGINGGLSFNNAGTVDVRTGILLFSGAAGTSTGLFTVADGAQLRLTTSFTFNAGTSFAGAGRVHLQGGAALFAGSVNSSVAQFSLDGANLQIASGQVLTTTGAADWTNGNVGNGQAALNGTWRVTGGLLLHGNVGLNNATLHVPAGSTLQHGPAGSALGAGSGALLLNEGTYRARSDNGFNYFGGATPVFQNVGTFIRETGTGTFQTGINGGIVFNNAGSVQVQSGTLLFDSGGTSTGSFSVASGALLLLGRDYTFDTGTTITGAGLLRLGTGTAIIPNSLTFAVATLQQTGSPLRIATGSTLTTTGMYEWLGGGIGNGSNGGTLNVAGGLLIDNNAGQGLDRSTLRVPAGVTATMATTGPTLSFGGGAQFLNEGTFRARPDGGFNYFGGAAPAFRNVGTFIREVGTGTFRTGINGGAPFFNSGSVQVESGLLLLDSGGESSGPFSSAGGTVIQFNRDYTWSPGTTFTGAGRLELRGGNMMVPENLSFSIATLRQEAGTLLVATGRTLTSGGLFEWTGGGFGNSQSTQSGTLRLNGGLEILGNGGQQVLNATLHLPAGAQARQTAGSGLLNFNNGARVQNDGTWYAQNDSGFNFTGGTGGVFANAGTFIRDTGTGTFQTGSNGGAAFLNTGTTSVQSGTLLINGGGSSTGAFEVASGALLSLTSVYTLDAGTTLTGAGRFSTGSSLILPESLSFSIARFQMVSGNLLVAAGKTLTLSGQFDWSSSSIGNGQAANSGTVRVTGSANLGNGGPLLNRANLVIASGASAFQETVGTSLNFGGGSELRNDGTYYARSNDGFNFVGGASNLFRNHGTFVRDSGTGTFNTGINGGAQFINAGAVLVQTGTVLLGGGGSAAGSFDVASGATLDFTFNYTLEATATVTGAGLLRFSGGTMQIPASLSLPVANVGFAGGFLNVAAAQTLALSGALAWSGGTLRGGGTLLAGAGTTLTNSTGLDGATFHNPVGATFLHSPGASLSINSGVLRNAGTYLARSDAGLFFAGGSALIENPGLLHRDSGSGAFSTNITFHNTGTVMVSSGTLRLDGPVQQFSAGTLSGGTWVVNAGATLTGGGFAGITTNNAIIRLDGAGSTFQPLSALQTNNGTLALANGATFVTAGSLTNNGLIDLSGGAFNVAGGGTLTNASGATIRGAGNVTGKLVNFGTVRATGPVTLVLTGEVTNNGLFLASAGGTINAAGTTFVNNGVLDRTTGTIILPAGFINNGVLIDTNLVKVRSTLKQGNTVTLTVDGFTGHTYQLQRSLDLAGDVFINLGAPQQGVSGETLTFVDTGSNTMKGFYRVVVDP